MELNINTPDQSVFSGKALSVTVPGSAGSFEILKDHAPIISTLEEGKIIIRINPDEVQIINIKGGLVEVHDNIVTLLAEGVLQVK